MATRFEKLTFPGSRGAVLAARLELPDREPSAYALFAYCFIRIYQCGGTMVEFFIVRRSRTYPCHWDRDSETDKKHSELCALCHWILNLRRRAKMNSAMRTADIKPQSTNQAATAQW